MKWVLLAELCVGKLSWLPASIMTSPTQFWNNKNVARQSEIFQQSNVWRSGITANPLQSSKFHSHGASNLTTKAKIGILPSLKKNSEANYQKKICTLQIIIIWALFFFNSSEPCWCSSPTSFFLTFTDHTDLYTSHLPCRIVSVLNRATVIKSMEPIFQLSTVLCIPVRGPLPSREIFPH